MEGIHVALAVDRRCLWGAAVSMRTLADQAGGAASLSFHVFMNGVGPEGQNLLRRTVESFGATASIELKEFDPEPVRHLLRSKLITHTAYALLFLDELIPPRADRCIYVDCDLFFNRDPLELWALDLGDHSVGAVDNGQWEDSVASQERLGLSEPRYFNSGVLLVDMRRWRGRAIGAKALQFAEEVGDGLLQHDQDALNRVLRDDWLGLPPHWNKWIIPEDALDLQEPAVFHFMGAPKPWHPDYHGPARAEFFRHLDRTAFAGQRPWNPLGSGALLSRARRKIPFLPTVFRMARSTVRSGRRGSPS